MRRHESPKLQPKATVRTRWQLAGAIVTLAALTVAVGAWQPSSLSPLRGLWRGLVAGLRWVHDHGLTSGGISAVAAVVGLVLTAWGTRGGQRDPRAPVRLHERRVMLQRVRYQWIECVLDRSLGREVWLCLGLAYRPDALPHDLAIHRPGGRVEPARPAPPSGSCSTSSAVGCSSSAPQEPARRRCYSSLLAICSTAPSPTRPYRSQ